MSSSSPKLPEHRDIRPMGSSYWSHQPGTALYTAFFVLFTLVRLPCLCLRYSIPDFRPDSQWTYRRSVSRTLFMYVCHYLATVKFQPVFNLKADREKKRFVIIEPERMESFRSILLCDPSISPGQVGAVWSPTPISTPEVYRAGQRVFLHLHGGAYVLGSARDIDMGFATSLLLKHSPDCAVFCPEYRLASLPGCRFPPALQDAVTAYDHLITHLKIPAENIVFSGDSAGAHLILALLRYVNTHSDIFPEPGAVLLWSPWPDMSIDVEIADDRPATHVDHVAPKLIAWTYRDFLPQECTNVPRSNPYLSPSKARIPTRSPIWVQWGSDEVLKEDIEKLIAVQTSVCDGERAARLSTYEVPHAPHDIFALAPLLGWKSEADAAVQQAIDFLRQCKEETSD
ncbi:Alpha/Beta hydrolase protein [Xylariaceae sp. FL0255]|nr:Alpha/Beta hydrolase protein [Xylariaceae sp. FL0255]